MELVPAGRPSTYSEEMADKVCAAIASTARGLAHICAADDMPSAGTVYGWLGRHPEFIEKYLRAREIQSHLVMDQVLDIADDGTNDYVMTDDGPSLDRDHIQRSKLRVETRFRLAGKLNPKRYGDKAEFDVKSSDGSMKPTVIEFGYPSIPADESKD